MEAHLDVQIMSLQAIFSLLQEHGLDYPNYYTRLYDLLRPQFHNGKKEQGTVAGQTLSIFSMGKGSQMAEQKARFLTLLDLSLRSDKLPSKTVAAFIKRLARSIAGLGCCCAQEDMLYVLGLIANLMKRHPRCIRLIHRAKKARQVEDCEFSCDPYRADEPDPLKSRALRSCLWELESLLHSSLDEKVRHFIKSNFMGDLTRKTEFFRVEESLPKMNVEATC